MQQTIDVPAQPGAPQVRVEVPGVGPSPSEVYQGLLHQRSELRDQRETLIEERGDLVGELQAPEVAEAAKSGLQTRIATLDGQIAEVDKALATANAEVARAAAIPGAVVEQPPPPDEFIDEDAVAVLAFLIFFLILLPISVAYTRRLWRRSGAVPMTLPSEMQERMTRLEQSVDSIAIEVERIGEGQRFMTRVLTEQREHQQIPVGTGDTARR